MISAFGLLAVATSDTPLELKVKYFYRVKRDAVFLKQGEGLIGYRPWPEPDRILVDAGRPKGGRYPDGR